jgi:hypothetical protein
VPFTTLAEKAKSRRLRRATPAMTRSRDFP